MAPILYDNPSGVPLATIAVITSPAPFANANNVTAANASGKFNDSEIYAMDGAKYSSTTAEINLNMMKMSRKDNSIE